MANRPPQYGDWRHLDNRTRLQVLANFFPNLYELSLALDLPIASIRTTLHNIAAGKNVRVTDSPKYIEAMRRARHRMTDRVRRIDKKLAAGGFEAPVIKYRGGVIVPYRPTVFIEYANKGKGKEVQSFWVHYRVEHLPYEEQREIARILFDWSVETGQFNDFRFEYLARADHYRETSHRPRRTFKDRGLQSQALDTNYVRLSTTHTPLLEISPSENSDEFLDFIDDQRDALIPRGLVQIIDWCFTWRKEYYGWKPQKRKTKASRKWSNKRGK